MPEFFRDAPRIELILWNNSSAAVRQAVIDREIHFGLVVNPRPHPDLVMVELFKDEVKLFTAAPTDAKGEYAFADEACARARLLQGPLLYAGPVTQSHQILDQLTASGCLPEHQLSCGDMDLVKSLVIGGLGVGILPQRVAHHHRPDALKCLHPTLPTIPDRIELLYRVDIHRTLAAMYLKDALVAHGQHLRGD
jgi:DNA-binding transcriptional LysR family regulator